MNFRTLVKPLVLLMTLVMMVGICATGFADEEPITLSLIHYNTEKPERPIFYEKVVDEYQQLHPNVKIEIIKTTFQEMESAVVQGVMVNKPYDIFMEPTSGQNLFVNNNIALDLTSYVDSDEAYKGSLANGVYDAMKYSNGNIYGLPEILDSLPLNYHIDILSELGVDPPTNLEEFMNYCQIAKDAGYIPFQLHGSMMDEFIDIIAFQFIAKYGVNIYDVLDGKVSFNEPWYIDTMTFVKNMYDKGYLPVNFWDIGGNDGRLAYATGLMPMKMGYFNDVDTHYDLGMPYENQGVAVFPNITGDNDLATYTRIKLRSYMVSSTCAHPDVAVDFLKFMLNSEHQNYNATQGYGKEPNRFPSAYTYVEMSDYAKKYLEEYSYGIGVNGSLLTVSLKMGEAYKTNIPLLMLGDLTVEECVKLIDTVRTE